MDYIVFKCNSYEKQGRASFLSCDLWVLCFAGSLETLEEEYHQAIATNIVQELLHQRKVQKSSPVEKENAEPKRSAGHKKHKHSLVSIDH